MTKRSHPSTITPDLFRAWRSPVRGNANPQRLTNPVWQWLVESRISAYAATQEFGGVGYSEGPGWCLDRFGQSTTTLRDGREVLIAGEHEDHYDPDFYIYNDVVIVSPDSQIEILGYPTDVFPPTDFHSATLVGDRIVLIGSLGYPNDRRQGVTQVTTIDCETWHAAPIVTRSQGPGWLHEHRAQLTDDGKSITVSGGKVDRCDGLMLVENIDDWRLHLESWEWERLTNRRWPRFEVFRQDRKRLHLWDMRQALWSKSVGWDDFEPQVENLRAELGGPPQLDIVATLYRPDIAHECLPEDEHDHRVYRIRIDDVIVRYVEDSFTLQATVEGELPADQVARLREDLVSKLNALERAAITAREITPA